VRRAAVIAALLLAGVASAAKPPKGLGGPGLRSGTGGPLGGHGLATTSGTRTTDFLVLTSDMASSGAASFCSTFATDWASGSRFMCRDPSGETGTMTPLVAAGSPAAVTPKVCNNGPDCATIAGWQPTAASDRLSTNGTVAEVDADFSVCIFARLAGAPAGSSVGALAGQRNGINSWEFVSTLVTLRFFIFKSGGNTDLTGSTNFAMRGDTYACATYDYVADGSSILKLYANGVEIGTTSTAVGPPLQGTNGYISLFGFVGTNPPDRGIYYAGVFVDDVVLSPAQILAQANHLRKKPTANGTAIGVARTGALTGSNDSWATLTLVQANEALVENSGLFVVPASTNILIRSEEFDHAAWTDVGTPTVTANGWIGADYIQTGDTIDDNDAAAFEGRAQIVASTTQVKYTASCFFQSGTATLARMVIAGTGNAAGDTTCDKSGLSGTTQRLSCTTTAAYGVGLTNVTLQVLVGNAVTDTGTIKAVGCELEALPYMSSYDRTEAAAVARAIGQYTIPFSAVPGMSGTVGCARAKFYTYADTTAAQSVVGFTGSGDSAVYVGSATTVGVNDTGTGSAVETVLSVVGREEEILGSWSATTLDYYHPATTNTGSVVGAHSMTGGVDTSIFLGTTGTPTLGFFGRIYGVKLGGTAGACQ
jgi:hypothetical protein